MSLSKISTKEIKLRIKVLNSIIDQSKGDPRIDEPKRQRKILLEELKKRETDKENIIIGLDTLEIKSNLGG